MLGPLGARFELEDVLAAAELHGPDDVRAFPEHGFYYCIRDHVDGVTLQKLMSSDKRFEPLQVLKILRQLVEALSPWHRAGLPHGSERPVA